MKTNRFVGMIVLVASLSVVSAVEPNSPGTVAGYLAIGASPDYLEAWLRPPVKGQTPIVPLIKEFHIGQTAFMSFIVTGIQPDEQGRGNVTVDFKLLKPDGSFMFDIKEYARVTGLVPSEPGFVIAKPALDLAFEEGDPIGQYSVVVVAHDLISKKASIAEVKINVHERKTN